MTTTTIGNSRIGQETIWSVAMTFLMLLNGFVTAQISGDGVKNRGSEGRGPPTINVPASATVNAELGRPLELACKAITGYSDTFSTIIYWVTNEQFIEDAFVDGRVKEGKEIFLTENGKFLIQKNLKFTETAPEDFKTSFTCAVMNPSGSSVKNITLVRKESLSKTSPCKRKLRKLKACLQANRNLGKGTRSTDEAELQALMLGAH